MSAKHPFRFSVRSMTAESPKQWRDLARRAEDLGYWALYLPDHYIGPGPALEATGHPVQDIAAIPAMTVAAEATTTLRVGAVVLCIGYHHPAVLAKELATIDFFSEGRLEIGLGAGWMAGEYEAMGIPFAPAGERIELLRDTVALLRAHFGDGLVDVKGSQLQAGGFEGLPKPAQRPSPPIIIGGGSRRVLSLGGAVADVVSLNLNNSTGRLGPEGLATIAADEKVRQLSWVEEGAGDRFDDLELEIGTMVAMVTDDTDATIAGVAGAFGLAPDMLTASPHTLVGSVDELVDTLQERRERYGINRVTVGSAADMEAFAPVVAKLAGT